MNVYIPLALYIILVSFIFRKKKIILIILTFVPLLLFFGTRVNMGADYVDYVYKYEQGRQLTLAQYLIDAVGGKFEPGFFLLIKLAPSFNALIFICTLIGMAPVAVFFYTFIPNRYYPLAIVFYLFSFKIFESYVAMRSGIVVGLFLLAIVLKNQGYRKIAIILTLMSGFFHTSGFFLVFIMLLTDNFLKKNYLFVSFSVFVLMILGLVLPSFYGNLFISLSSPIQELEAYRGHIISAENGLGFYLFSIFRFCFVIYILSLIKRGLIEDRYIWMAWMTILCYFLYMVQGVDVMYRFIFYFYLITIPFKCYVLAVDKTRYSMLYVGLSLAYLFYTFVGFLRSDHCLLYYAQYQSFLF